MMRFDPFRDIEELAQRLGTGASAQQVARFSPPVDIHEDERGLELTLDLPGVSPDGLQIEAENNTLSIQAERKYARAEGRTAHRVERAYGTFSRSFSVPPRYDLTKVEADFDHGTLTLRVPRSEAAQKRTVTVRSGGTVQQPKVVEAGSASAAEGSRPSDSSASA